MTSTQVITVVVAGTIAWSVTRVVAALARRARKRGERGAELLQSLRAGSLVAARGDDGFGIAKVLAIGAGVVHICLYQERFSTLEDVRLDAPRTLGSFGPGRPFSIGHLPLSSASFLSWSPTPVGFDPVTEAELQGYRMWEESQGGVFG